MGDVRDLWPGWVAGTHNRHRIGWRIVDDHSYGSSFYASTHDRFLCEYVGRSKINKQLIDNRNGKKSFGRYEFPLTHRFKSSELLLDLVIEGAGLGNDSNPVYFGVAPCMRVVYAHTGRVVNKGSLTVEIYD